jgi:hypothetical protein
VLLVLAVVLLALAVLVLAVLLAMLLVRLVLVGLVLAVLLGFGHLVDGLGDPRSRDSLGDSLLSSFGALGFHHRLGLGGFGLGDRVGVVDGHSPGVALGLRHGLADLEVVKITDDELISLDEVPIDNISDKVRIGC